jgi:hypothetical protein
VGGKVNVVTGMTGLLGSHVAGHSDTAPLKRASVGHTCVRSLHSVGRAGHIDRIIRRPLRCGGTCSLLPEDFAISAGCLGFTDLSTVLLSPSARERVCSTFHRDGEDKDANNRGPSIGRMGLGTSRQTPL